MRSREWRRRIGGDGEVCGQTFDGGVTTDGDDGYSADASGFVTDQGEFYIGDVGGTAYGMFARFPSVTVPQGATVELAYVNVYMTTDAVDGSQKTNLTFNDVDDATAPTTAGEWAALAKTDAFTAWDDVDYSAGYINSPDLTDEIQEVLDRGGWVSGQAMQLVWRDDGSASGNYANGSDYGKPPAGSREPQIHIQYCA